MSNVHNDTATTEPQDPMEVLVHSLEGSLLSQRYRYADPPVLVDWRAVAEEWRDAFTVVAAQWVDFGFSDPRLAASAALSGRTPETALRELRRCGLGPGAI